jgi:hypothetical protein
MNTASPVTNHHRVGTIVMVLNLLEIVREPSPFFGTLMVALIVQILMHNTGRTHAKSSIFCPPTPPSCAQSFGSGTTILNPLYLRMSNELLIWELKQPLLQMLPDLPSSLEAAYHQYQDLHHPYPWWTKGCAATRFEL